MARSDTAWPEAIDIKITLAGPDLPRARTAFGLGERTARRSVLHFCDRPAGGRDLTMLDAGLVLRLRADDGGGGDARVLLRPCWPERLTPAWTRPLPRGPRIRVAGDWTPHARTVAAAATSPVTPVVLDEALGESGRLADAFTPRQHRLVADAAPRALTWGLLRAFGPVDVRTWRCEVDGGGLRASWWTVRATRLEMLELRVTAAAGEAELALAALAATMRVRGLDPEAFGTTKTAALLDGG